MRSSEAALNGVLQSKACSTMPSSRSPRVMSWYSAKAFRTLSSRFSIRTPVCTRSTSSFGSSVMCTNVSQYIGTYNEFPDPAAGRASCRGLFIIAFQHFHWFFRAARRNSLLKDSLGIRRQRLRTAAPEAETDRGAGPDRVPEQVRVHAHDPADSGGLLGQDRGTTGESASQRARCRTRHGDPIDGQGRLLPLAAGGKAAPDLRKKRRGGRQGLRAVQTARSRRPHRRQRIF